MNHFIEYICRSTMRSEDAVRCLNKRVTKLAKCCSQTNVAVFCFGLVSLGTLAIIATQDQEIKALKKQVEDLANDTGDTTENTEDTIQQEGA